MAGFADVAKSIANRQKKANNDTYPPADFDSPKALQDHANAWNAFHAKRMTEETAGAKNQNDWMAGAVRAMNKTNDDMKARAKKLRMQDTGATD